ncbi:MAG: hypothetical protein JSS39_19915 [Nitrospira sp.]|nr:hypothetical protein [Nitrospira sp.]
MAINLEVAKAELGLEAGYSKPNFGFLSERSTILSALYKHMEPYGLRLMDLRLEHGGANVFDNQIVFYLFNYGMTVRIRVDRLEIACTELPKDHVEKVKSSIVDVFKALTDYRPEMRSCQ